jgi:transcriptional regulator with XRE-family HTH domain
MTTITKIEIVADLGRLMREKRLSLSTRQAEVAGLSGVGVRFLSELERGKATCEIGKTMQVLDCLGLDIWIVPRGETVVISEEES